MGRIGTKSLGDQGEAAASDWLVAHGYQVLDRNARTRFGEIDLVVRRGDLVIFVEVKSRTGTGFGHPGEAVAISKRRRLARLASAYLVVRGLDRCAVRFDVIAVHAARAGGVMEIEHIPDAFQVAM